MICDIYSALLVPGALQAAGTERQMTALFNEHGSVTATISQEFRPHLPREIRLSNIEELVPRDIVFNDAEITLREQPNCVLRCGMTIAVKGWGIECAYENAYNIPREMARRFLLLYGKAQGGILSESEKACWGYIVDRVDYAAFCDARARPIRYEGILKNREGDRITIEWADGTNNQVRGQLSSRLDLINKDECFTCMVKFRNGAIANIYDVTPFDNVSDNDDWSWIEQPV